MKKTLFFSFLFAMTAITYADDTLGGGFLPSKNGVMNAVEVEESSISEQSLTMQYGVGVEVVRLDANNQSGWNLRGGVGRVTTEDGAVQVCVLADKKNAIYQYDLPIKGRGYRALQLQARWRLQGVRRGDAAWKVASIQARWKKGGMETGSWIVLGKGSGSTDWNNATVEVSIPREVDSLMIRVANYGLDGHIDIENFSILAFGVANTDTAAVEADKKFIVPIEEYGQAPSLDRLARFSRGVSINQWFDQPYNGKIGQEKGTFTRSWQDRYVTDAELRALVDAGFRCIRLPIDPEPYMERPSGEVKPIFDDVMHGVRRIREAGLTVIVNPHPKMQAFKSMYSMSSVREAFLVWSRKVAEMLEKEFGPDAVMYEPLNEPAMCGFPDVSTWMIFQNRLIAAVREGAPNLTLVLNSGRWQGVDDLVNVAPHPDRNVVWSVHYYEPMAFTHQGSPWMKSWYQPIRNLPWPYTTDDLPEIADSMDRNGKNMAAADESVAVIKRQAADGRGSVQRVERDFKRLAEWSSKYRRNVCIGEFGVDATYSQIDDRVRWTSKIRKLCDEYGFIWQHWGYDQRLRVATGEPGHRTFEPFMLHALGL